MEKLKTNNRHRLLNRRRYRSWPRRWPTYVLQG